MSKSRAAALVALILLLATLVTGAPGASAQAADCPEPYPLGQVQRGLRATGRTVVEGNTPENFDVEVLGVFPDGVMPGRDMIVVRISGLPDIDETGGWFGMSGSPVYVGDQLLGAFAFGFSGASNIGGLTPAQDMLDVLDLDADADAQRLRRQAATSVSTPYGTARALPVPVGISGVSARRMDIVRDAADRAGLNIVPYAMASAPGANAQQAPRTPVPGGNFAEVVSYGDVSFAGIGTTTIVCNGQAMAFGHPGFWLGGTSLGASDAEAFGIVKDSVFGSFKLAYVTNPFGTVDQDRLAGVRTDLGPLPDTIPVTSTLTDLTTDKTENFRSDVAESLFIPDITFFQQLGGTDATIDRIGPGGATVRWTATGTTANGQRWRLDRENVYASQFDISFESIFEMLNQLAVVYSQPFTEASFDAVDIDATFRQDFHLLTITKVQARLPDGTYGDAFEIPAEPGGTVDLRVFMDPYREREQTVVDVSLQVPADVPPGSFGFVEITGGPSFADDPVNCLFDPAACPAGEGDSFLALVDAMENRARNDELVATLRIDPFFSGPPGVGGEVVEDVAVPLQVEPPVPTGPQPPADEVRTRMDRVVQGQFQLPVFVGGGPSGPGINRVAGEGRVETAVSLSQFMHPGAANGVVLANGNGYADALAGAPLAAQLGGPVLLTGRDGLHDSVAEEITRLGATNVVLLGGTGVLSDQVMEDVEALGVPDVERIGGASRFETARLVAERVGGERVVIVKGSDRSNPDRAWPDAVAASGYAAFTASPILLVQADAVPRATMNGLRNLGVTSAVIVGGPGAVSEGVEATLADEGIAVERVAGTNRYETSRAVAERTAGLGGNPFVTFVATGRAYADALAAGPAAAAAGGVLLLVDGQSLDGSPSAREWLSAIPGGFVTVVGGPGAVTPRVEEEIAQLVLGGGPIPVPEPIPGGPAG